MTSEKTQTAFNLPYNQSPYFWLAVFTPADNEGLRVALMKHGMKPMSLRTDVYTICFKHPWHALWKAARESLSLLDTDRQAEVALIPGAQEPSLQEYGFARKPAAQLDLLADSLWLGDALIEDRIVCYMQPVLDKRGKVFGYESFARVETESGVIGGRRILDASRGLNVEYLLDRHMHVKAITSFISSDLEGFLFINFVPGFIHRPEKYLEGLTDAAKFHGMPAKQLVLDFTHSELSRDPAHVKSIFDYCRSKGYSLSLDDISSLPVAKKILDNIHPDFIKLDIELVRNVREMAQQRTVNELVTLAHNAGATVLAEGVETKEMHEELLRAGVDLFQGYLFSPPVAISALKKVAG
jgi:EAL domain-containing protein (putative c-di-GMP-specific phosphodiesterase class I)